MGYAKIQIIGNLGRDPEIRYTPNGKPVTEFSVAVNQGRKDPQTGAWSDESDWFRISVWGSAAETAAEKYRKGSKVLVDGRFRSREYEKDGVRRTSLEISADQVVGLDSRPAAPEVDPSEPF